MTTIVEAPGRARSTRGLAPDAAVPDAAPGGLLFHEPWWLAAVTGGRCQEVVATSNGQVVGRLPYIVTRRLGLTLLHMPPFTHVLGPVVDAGKGKAQTQLLRRLSIVRELLDQLPRFDAFKQALQATTVDGLAFQDRGFQISPQYTFQVDCQRDLEDLWQDMHFKTRQHIRRAEEKFRVAPVEDPDEFVRFYLSNLHKRGRRSTIDFAPFPTVFSEARRRDSGEILRASWPDGRAAAMVYLVWGQGRMYYLLSTRASDAGDNGSVNLLIWSAMQRAHARGLRFDLDGVSSSGTARFLSGFGGQMEMRLIARRSRFLHGALQGTKRYLVGGVAEETHAFT